MPGPLDGKVALITGAVRRNGRATAHALAKDGAAIVINTRSSADEARKVQAEIEALGGQALVCVADITNEDAVAGMFRAIEARFGRVDILVNNAADRARTPFTEMTFAQWRHFTSIIGCAFLSLGQRFLYVENGWDDRHRGGISITSQPLGVRT